MRFFGGAGTLRTDHSKAERSILMNSDFPRIIALQRKERQISQKQAAADLGISQALLSHYEKGIRECGLDFLVKIADYYNVSCDYLLGRTPEPEGKTITIEDIPDDDGNNSMKMPSPEIINFNRRIINNSISLLFSLAQKANSITLIKEVSSYLMLSVYKLFRIEIINAVVAVKGNTAGSGFDVCLAH